MGIMAEIDQTRKDVMSSFSNDIFGPEEDEDQMPHAAGNAANAEETSSDVDDETTGFPGVNDGDEDDDDQSEEDDPDEGDGEEDGETESAQVQNHGKVSDESKASEKGKKDTNPEAKEAERKAEWERKQVERKAEESRKLQEIQNMDPSEVAAASVKLVSQGIERLTRRNMKIEVGNHITNKCAGNPEFAAMVMHPRKSIVRCFQYINQKARDYLVEERKLLEEVNKETTGGINMEVSGDVPDEMCYTWAEEYYEKPDLDIDKTKDETYKPKYVPSKASKSSGNGSSKKSSASKKETAKAVLTPSKTSILDDMEMLG